jgi:tetratricopeptide (TPR) repeat protein
MLRASGNLDGALAAIQSGVALIQPEAESALGQHRTYALALTTEAEVLGQDEAVSLGRPDQAIPLLERAYALMSDAVERDPNETQSRFMATTTLRTFAAIVRHRDPDRALQFYERALTLSRQIANNARARRDEVSAHAGAARTLTAMARFGEARRHLARAFEQLAMLKLYPAASISAGSEAYFALRARAELEAASGDPARAADTLTGLLDAVVASDAKPDTNLLDAFDVALIHSDLATVHRRAGREDLATAANARRRDLWSQWQRRLPANPFVQRQLAAID